MSGREVDLSDNLAFGEGFPHATFMAAGQRSIPLAYHDAEVQTAKAFGSSAATDIAGSLPDAGDFFLEHRR